MVERDASKHIRNARLATKLKPEIEKKRHGREEGQAPRMRHEAADDLARISF